MSDARQRDIERNEVASYQRWKAQSFIPFRYSFYGLLILGVVGGVHGQKLWETQFKPLVIVFAFIFATGCISLFVDIPRRRLGRFSKAFLGLGIAVLVVLFAITVVNRFNA